ncbi:uncharacterized protein BDR25DRAFT_359791 [Lindgomyces ingoldianus]|uniref:Uncharacterized protein n=1 Tax=Lindgomyces ingoldianus TaxID=673940 RepID=A0ACB6QIP4_9PLEO|nr:uncharacterized protein BDR25DRAFT_359791 [Lindgomyces ingoldianus]KAF2466463.1 hypothetical protein BDR25DRAFT_359791 [Lindgomyces ingoldianus]
MTSTTGIRGSRVGFRRRIGKPWQRRTQNALRVFVWAGLLPFWTLHLYFQGRQEKVTPDYQRLGYPNPGKECSYLACNKNITNERVFVIPADPPEQTPTKPLVTVGDPGTFDYGCMIYKPPDWKPATNQCYNACRREINDAAAEGRTASYGCVSYVPLYQVIPWTLDRTFLQLRLMLGLEEEDTERLTRCSLKRKVIEALPAIAEIGCFIIISTLKLIFEVMLDAIPGVGEAVNAGMGTFAPPSPSPDPKKNSQIQAGCIRFLVNTKLMSLKSKSVKSSGTSTTEFYEAGLMRTTFSISFNWAGALTPNYGNDWGLRANPCWPEDIVSEDPGFVLLTDDNWYNTAPSSAVLADLKSKVLCCSSQQPISLHKVKGFDGNELMALVDGHFVVREANSSRQFTNNELKRSIRLINPTDSWRVEPDTPCRQSRGPVWENMSVQIAYRGQKVCVYLSSTASV